jgi:hypothetical protein
MWKLQGFKWQLSVPKETMFKLLKGEYMKKLIVSNIRGIELEINFITDKEGDLDRITDVRCFSDGCIWDILSDEARDQIREKVLDALMDRGLTDEIDGDR